MSKDPKRLKKRQLQKLSQLEIKNDQRPPEFFKKRRDKQKQVQPTEISQHFAEITHLIER